jgi:hypothetical protein
MFIVDGGFHRLFFREARNYGQKDSSFELSDRLPSGDFSRHRSCDPPSLSRIVTCQETLAKKWESDVMSIFGMFGLLVIS